MLLNNNITETLEADAKIRGGIRRAEITTKQFL